MTVRTAVILARKGADVATIEPGASLLDAARVLAERNIGALVVSADAKAVDRKFAPGFAPVADH